MKKNTFYGSLVLVSLMLALGMFSMVSAEASNTWKDGTTGIQVKVSFGTGGSVPAVNLEYSRTKGGKVIAAQNFTKVKTACNSGAKTTKPIVTKDGVEIRFICRHGKNFPQIKLPGWKNFKDLSLKKPVQKLPEDETPLDEFQILDQEIITIF